MYEFGVTILFKIMSTTITYTQTKPTPTTITVTNPPITTTVTVVTPPATTTIASGGQCNTGSLQCCNSVQKASSSGVGLLLGLLGVVLGDVNVLVGVTCSPLSVIGVGGNSCTAQPVCCENNNFNGVIAIGCTPININL
ncbi:hydrophobin-domain-containing protein [Dendrothele bispora CBS 962.96]|uniref:Hydrophobin n=2 Tax=Dendrothele bispora (strain CBS 962.96) TaxID=1314807 RepID=A0A4S8KPY5_DENBC|nr:hydrophobin-domain-containing protein [Dendrothele bispora CBS 962.96]